MTQVMLIGGPFDGVKMDIPSDRYEWTVLCSPPLLQSNMAIKDPALFAEFIQPDFTIATELYFRVITHVEKYEIHFFRHHSLTPFQAYERLISGYVGGPK